MVGLKKFFRQSAHHLFHHHHHDTPAPAPAPASAPAPAQQATISQLQATAVQNDAKIQTLRLEMERKAAEAEALKQKYEEKQAEEEKISQENMGNINEKHYGEAVGLYASVPLRGDIPRNTIGFIGRSGVGKSHLINSLSKKIDLVKVGRNQTTLEIRVHHHQRNNDEGIDYIDIPGMTDCISYLSTEYMSVFKSVAWIGLVIENNIDEVRLLAKLFDRIGKRYVIIVNKLDDEPNGIEEFKTKTLNQIRSHSFNIDPINDIFFVSAKEPTMPNADWGKLTQRLQNDIPSYQY